jgi:hypothetical protein
MPDVENNPVNFTSAFCDLVAVEERKMFRTTLIESGLINEWRIAWEKPELTIPKLTRSLLRG